MVSSITVTSFERQHEQAVDNLLFYAHHLHTHIDWHEPLDWMSRFEPPVRLAWRGEKLAGLMAASTPINGTAWLRIAALADFDSGHTIFDSLWNSMAAVLRDLQVAKLYVLLTRPWIKKYLRPLDFAFAEEVITFQHNSTSLPRLQRPDVDVRRITPADIPQILALDHEAFAPPWQMSVEDVRQALRTATICTTAEQDQRIVGYQFSTVYRNGAHLARLAVAPQQQGQGIGKLLLHHVLEHFSRRQITTMTVNTQESNHRSQQLYRHFGFYRNGYDLSVWSITLQP